MNAGQAALQQQQYVILPEKDSDDHYQAQAIPQSGDPADSTKAKAGAEGDCGGPGGV